MGKSHCLVLPQQTTSELSEEGQDSCCTYCFYLALNEWMLLLEFIGLRLSLNCTWLSLCMFLSRICFWIELTDLHDCTWELVWGCLSGSHSRINNHCDEAGSFSRFIVPEAGVGHIHISKLAAAQRTLLFLQLFSKHATTKRRDSSRSETSPARNRFTCIFMFELFRGDWY